MEKVGIRQIKSLLSSYIRKVKQGDVVIITERGVPVAKLSPIFKEATDEISEMVKEGLVSWQGGKPEKFHPIKINNSKKTVAEMVSEDRR